MVSVRIHCVGYSYVSVAIICYHSNSVGIVFFDSIDELAFVKCYGVVMVAVRIHCVGHSYITLAIICYRSNGVGILSIFLNKALQSIFINTDYIILISQIATAYAVIYSNDSMTGFCSSNSIGIIFLNGLDELIFVNAYGIIVITVIIYHFGNIYITIAVSLRSSNGIGIIFLNGLHELIFVNAYSVIIITVIIYHFGNIYITIAVSLCGSNGVSIILLYKITQLIAVDINLIRMIAISAFIGDFQHIGFRFYSSNSIGILCCFLDIALQSVLIDTDLIILTVFLTFHAIIYSNDIVNRFSSCNGVGIIILNGLHELIFVNAHGVIIITVIINHFGNIYITFAVSLCGSNGVSIILLYKITQLIAVNINLVRMVAISAFIGDFQHIAFRFYGSNSISSGNTFQLISYPAAGSNTFYLSLYAVLVGILNLYRQLAIFIQASFHAGISGISINNTLHLLVYPALRSNTVYAVGVNSAGIISNLGSQRAVCKGQFIASNLGIGINNGCSKHLIISSYQLIGIDCLPLTGSCSNRFNNSIFQACLTCFTVNSLRHGDIIGIERFDNSVKFTYRNLRHRLLALHFGIIALMYGFIARALRIPLIIISMVNKRSKQFNLLAGADLYLCMS